MKYRHRQLWPVVLLVLLAGVSNTWPSKHNSIVFVVGVKEQMENDTDYNNNDSDDTALMFDHENTFDDTQQQRSVVEDNEADANIDSCSIVCDTDDGEYDTMKGSNTFTSTTTTATGPNSLLSTHSMNVQLMSDDDDEEEEEQGGIFNGFIGGFLGRLFNRLFRRFNNKPKTPNVNIPTSGIVSVLSSHSKKFLSLSELIRLESSNDATLSSEPDILQRMYTLSADNMESVSFLFNPIIGFLEQQETIDLTTLGCILKQIVSVIYDVTLPNIELMRMVLYTKTQNPVMESKYNAYDSEQSGATFFTTQSNTQDDSCTDTTTRTTASVPLNAYTIGDIIQPGEDVGIIQHVGNIILLIAFFPVAIVIGVVSSIIVLIGGIFLFILSLFGITIGLPAPDDDEPFSGIIPGLLIVLLFALFAGTVGAPVVTIYFIFLNIQGIVMDIRDLSSPAPSPPTGFPSPNFPPLPSQPITPSSPTSIFTPFINSQNRSAAPAPVPVPSSRRRIQSRSNPRDVTRINNLFSLIEKILQSPIKAIFDAMQPDVVQDDTSKLTDEANVMDCRLETLICQNDEFLEALPF